MESPASISDQPGVPVVPASTPKQATTPPLVGTTPSVNDSTTDEFLLHCRCESARFLATLLASLDASQALQPVTVFCSPTSLTFHVHGKAKNLQSSVDIPADVFMDYQVKENGEFSVNLTTVLECLALLNPTSKKGNDAPQQPADTTYQLRMQRCGVGIPQNNP